MNTLPQVSKTAPAIIKAINTAFIEKEKRGWDKLFYFFDIHSTMLYPDYNNTDPKKFYEHAEVVLQYLSQRDDIELGLYTCSYPMEIKGYLEFFESRGIKFVHVNRNNDAQDTKYGYYRDKPYYNVLFEDKAGFDGENDWIEIRTYFDI